MSEEYRKAQIEEAQNILDRIIGFINNCDQKAGIMLATIGVMIAVGCTSDSFTELKRIVDEIMKFKGCRDYAFFIWIIVSVSSLCFGLYKIILSLTACIDPNILKEKGISEIKSIIFFGDISNRNDFNDFKKDFTDTSVEEYLNDLLSQIYINSHICDRKFENYNKGRTNFIRGLSNFLAFALSGSFIY